MGVKPLKVLITGAAGYIGSVVTREVVKEANLAIAFDNLTKGHRQAVGPGVELVPGDLTDRESLERVFQSHKIDAVIHLAAESVVASSTSDPGRFFQVNTVGGLNLLEFMMKHGVSRLIFSSSAAVYGNPTKQPIAEDDPKLPINPYGESKLMFERILDWYGRAHGLQFVILRYFNAAGASRDLGEDHDPETHLIPNVLKAALGQREEIRIFGNDYPTEDGSCVRDYVHVLDIARAHIIPLKSAEKNRANKAFNLGSNQGHSVFEVVETARRVTGREIKTKLYPRRPGDPAVLIADAKLAKSELGWQPEFSNLEDIIESAWQWQLAHPHGYR
jgi:UDP-glucose 4-epimerase